ncbi:MAG: hypothetical protein UU48_C0015G0018 [Candidatus Uhrbacteria bacterium GW2011_GWF2_41_16]|uniref:Uncharacterized protein n=2 Tax=Candidatus Uhriibacteriota TaxID=1752732 RepID=A0A0G0YAW0_9BACT|nr:MAG: hypothetical protein UU35_C0016G0018 [Candidatus Uhrbacteria bacterium GW2011_GWC2_41_11]KKR97442.1 MAG: hypothetical protein UU48_C0015G0018 [Candidatus Uhrbacteria bacterium GW2011_GWF2_41_16]
MSLSKFSQRKNRFYEKRRWHGHGATDLDSETGCDFVQPFHEPADVTGFSVHVPERIVLVFTNILDLVHDRCSDHVGMP